MAQQTEQKLNTSGSVETRYAAQALAAANGQFTDEQARTMFIACTGLAIFARDAEHAAFMALSEQLTGQPASAADFRTILKKHLGKCKEQMVFIGQVLKGEGA